MSSINTNAAALVALQSLRATQSALADTSNRVMTGMKVADATDNPTLYAIAQDLRGRMAAQSNIRDGMDRVNSALDAGLTSADNVQKILIEMRTRAAAVQTGNLTVAQMAAMNNEFAGLRDQIVAIVAAAGVNGLNLVNDSTQSFAVRVNDTDFTQTITVTGQGLTTASLGVDVLNITTSANAATALQTISGAISTVNAALAALGGRSNILTLMKEFSQKLSDSIEKNIGSLVDADLPRESSRLQALQTKQQLNMQALAIANQQPQLLLQLFR